jgi:hypothetical protein
VRDDDAANAGRFTQSTLHEERKMKLTMSEMVCIGTLGLFAFGATGAQAATDAEKNIKNQYNATVDQAEADYKAAVAACDGRQGNEKDVCMQQAKANRDKAKADAKASRKSQDAMTDAREDKMEADYKVAKEKCDALSGDAKDACISSAKLKFHQ